MRTRYAYVLATTRRLGLLLAAALIAPSPVAWAALDVGGESGFLDTEFGSLGVAAVSFAAPASAAAALALPDGRVLLAGVVDDPDDGATLALTRLRPDGSVDATFGSTGRVVADLVRGRAGSPFGPTTGRAALARDRTGRILVAVSVESSTAGHGIAVARFGRDGAFDAGFGDGGRTVLEFPAPAGRGVAIPYAAPNALTVDDAGRILVAGVLERFGYSRQGLALARLERDGRRDLSFGERGLVTGPTAARAIAVDRRGRIVVAGRGLIRLLADGRPDPAFAPTRRDLEAHAVRIRLDGSIEAATAYGLTVFDAAGRRRSGAPIRADAYDARFAGGAIDPTGGAYVVYGFRTSDPRVRRPLGAGLDRRFGAGGSLDLPEGFTASGLAVEPAGSLLVAGAVDGAFAVSRVLGVADTATRIVDCRRRCVFDRPGLALWRVPAGVRQCGPSCSGQRAARRTRCASRAAGGHARRPSSRCAPGPSW
ncbi:MAG: hypothetical protein ACT4QF_00880 [Sporichthyaceae bacterium]